MSRIRPEWIVKAQTAQQSTA